jgi:hypothetical protein
MDTKVAVRGLISPRPGGGRERYALADAQIKSAHETACLCLACQITAEAYGTVFAAVREGEFEKRSTGP